jgi:hypothetical protein
LFPNEWELRNRTKFLLSPALKDSEVIDTRSDGIKFFGLTHQRYNSIFLPMGYAKHKGSITKKVVANKIIAFLKYKAAQEKTE